MNSQIEKTSLWLIGLGSKDADQEIERKKELLRSVLKRFREHAAVLTSRISATFPQLTVHDLTHLDALWETADLIAGAGYPLNPMEAFVFGGAILLHDAAHCFEAYEGGQNAVRNSMAWKDAFASEKAAHPEEILEKLEQYSDFTATLVTVVELIHRLEKFAGRTGLSIGIGHPGSISPTTGLIRNSNSVCLNGKPLKRDLEALLGRTIRVSNDANCLALSEASDGAAAGASNVFAVILGTGVGAGIVINGAPLVGANGIAGEWSHNPLPWKRVEWDENQTQCWCGKRGCIETWLSGVGLAADHARVTQEKISTEEIVARAEAGDERCAATLSRYEDRLSRALAHVINVLDPEVVVLGGGVSRIQRLYRHVPALWDQWIFSDDVVTKLVPAMHGDSSGVRGAAWLWPEV